MASMALKTLTVITMLVAVFASQASAKKHYLYWTVSAPLTCPNVLEKKFDPHHKFKLGMICIGQKILPLDLPVLLIFTFTNPLSM